MSHENTDFDGVAEEIQEINNSGENIHESGSNMVNALIDFNDTIEIPRAIIDRVIKALEYQYSLTEEFVGDDFVNKHIAEIIETSCSKTS